MKDFLKIILFVTLLFAVPYLVLADRQPGEVYPSAKWKLSFSFGKKYDYNNILVKRVVDGDTLQLESGEKVRLIGIDTPEMHESNKLHRDARQSGQDLKAIIALGREAYAFTEKLAEGKRVKLEFDAEKYDKYNRLLAYVYLTDGIFINAKIVEEGYASLLTIPPNVRYADLFLKLYRQAREERRGLWK
jgi:micrococcal nuclease